MLSQLVKQSASDSSQMDVPSETLFPWLNIISTAEIMYGPMIWFAKATLLQQFARLFAPLKSGAVYRAIQVSIWLNLMYYVGATIATVLQSRMVVVHNLPEVQLLFRGKVGVLFTITGAINIVSDVAILVIPLWAIWHLKISPKRKLGVSAWFTTGVLYVEFLDHAPSYPLIVVFIADDVNALY